MTGFPLNDFLDALRRVDRARLVRADPVKLAEKYGVSADHARGYIKLELGRL